MQSVKPLNKKAIIKRWAPSLMGMLILSACQMMGPNYQRPSATLPEQYKDAENTHSASEAASMGTWWQLYQDETLNGLVKKAFENNSDVKLAAAKVEEADAALREVGAALFPQVNLDSSGTRTRVTETGANPVFNGLNPRENYNIKLGTTFELDFWGKLRRGTEAARAQELSTQYAKDTVYWSLSSLVVNNFLLLRSLDGQILVANDSLATRKRSLELTQSQVKGGIASSLDVYQAEVAVSNLEAQIIDLLRQRGLAENQLAILTGELNLKLEAGDISALPLPPVPPVGLPSTLMESRPDVKQAEQQLVAANAKVGIAKAALYPSITLTTNYGGESKDLSDVLKSASRIWTGGLSLNLPIFDSGKLNSRLDQATAVQKQMLASYESAVRNAFTDVENALINTKQLADRELALKRSKDSALNALRVAENRYKSGYSAYINVLDAQRVYNDAALACVQGRQARLAATVDLFKALGTGWVSK